MSHPEPVNLAFGTNTSLLELATQIEKTAQLQADVRHRDPRPGDVPHSQADNAVLRSLFADVEPVSLEDGLEATVAWFGTHSASLT